MADSTADKELILGFVEESREGLQSIEADLLALENAGANPDIMNRIFRVIHSMKGASGFLSLIKIEALSHKAETLLSEVKAGAIAVDRDIIDTLLGVVDALLEMVTSPDQGEAFDVSEWCDKLQAHLEKKGRPAAATPAAQPAQNNHNGWSPAAPAPEPPPAAPQAQAPAHAPAKIAQPVAETPVAKAGKPAGGSDVSSIRLNVKVLDDLLELIGEVVLGRNQFMRKFENDPVFSSLSQRITKLHQHVIQTRMQPIGNVFDRFSRTVRDLSLKVGKEITLHLEGNELELDRTIIEKMSDPLTHLVRNAVDHAVEFPDERIKAGKSRMGHIYLRAYQESGQIIFEVEDDGKGLDIDRIKSKGIDKGLITAEQAAEMTEKEIIDLIFEPGFSTKEQANEISGRGVGMDVVKTNLEMIGCVIDIATRKGKGTLFSARMPLTEAIVNSSIISALIVGLGKHRFAIPQMGVNEIVKLNPKEQKERIEKVEGHDVFRLRDRLVPLVHLEDILELARTYVHPASGEALPDNRKTLADRRGPGSQPGRGADRRCGDVTFVILKFKQDYFGVLVDEILGIEEIVVKNLPRLIKNCRVFSGVSMIGDGEVALILDTNGIVDKAKLNFNHKKQSNEDQFWQKKRLKVEKQELLLFSNAENELFAIPLNLVSLIERIEPSKIEKVGTDEFVQIQGASLPLLRLENQLNVSPIAPDRRHVFVIKPDRMSYPIGIVAGKILKTVEMEAEVNSNASRGKGILGTIIDEGKMVMVLDLYSVVQGHMPEKIAQATHVSLQGLRVLYAEDSIFFQQLLPQYLADTGATLTVVEDGQEAMRKLNADPRAFDVVVSDIEMPNMDGFELVLNLRSNPETKYLPIIALTSLAGEEHRKKGMEMGFDAYEKKIDKERVLNCIRKVFDQKRKEAAQRSVEAA